MEKLSRKLIAAQPKKIKVLQFGEGNFLRAFVEWIIQKMNDDGVFDGGVAVVQPMPMGRVKDLAAQDGLYTLVLEGIEDGKPVSKRQLIDVLCAFNNPYEDYEGFLDFARSPDLEIVVSNTTEAGIALDETDTDFCRCPKSFPGKLLALLLKRYEVFRGDLSKGLCIIPCELIDYNGAELKKTLLQLAELCALPKGFTDWLEQANSFTDTLVDRIVPGYPAAEIDKIRAQCNYEDSSVVKGEIFHLWVLSDDARVRAKFPADKCGLNVIFARDITPYKQRKVKILNGSHTAIVPVGYLMGYDTVGETVSDKNIGRFLKELIREEINPTIELPQQELEEFGASVLDRFSNPYIRHELMSIALNSTTKFKTRLVPTLKDYIARTGRLPQRLLFAFAALMRFYRGDRGGQRIALRDNPEYLAFWQSVWEKSDGGGAAVCAEACANVDAFGEDLSKLHPELVKSTAEHLHDICTLGMEKALEKFLR